MDNLMDGHRGGSELHELIGITVKRGNHDHR